MRTEQIKRVVSSFLRRISAKFDIDEVKTHRLITSGWWSIDKNGKMVSKEDTEEQLYIGDGPADIMGNAIEKIFYEYIRAFKRPPKRKEIQAVFNFCSNPVRYFGEPENKKNIEYTYKNNY